MTKNWKSKISDDNILPFPFLFCHGTLYFCSLCCFHGKICRSKSPFLKILKKVKRWVFLYHKIRRLEFFYCFFSCPSSLPVQHLPFGPQRIDRGFKMRTKWEFAEIIVNSSLIIIFDNSSKKKFFLQSRYDQNNHSNCVKTKVTTKKFDKSTLKYTERGAFSTSKFDWSVERGPAIWQPILSKFAFFGIFEKMKNGLL